MKSQKVLQVAGKRCLGDQEGDDVRVCANVHRLHDRAVLDALEDAAPEIGKVGVTGLDLDGYGGIRTAIDHVDAIGRVQDELGFRAERRIGAPTAPGLSLTQSRSALWFAPSPFRR